VRGTRCRLDQRIPQTGFSPANVLVLENDSFSSPFLPPAKPATRFEPSRSGREQGTRGVCRGFQENKSPLQGAQEETRDEVLSLPASEVHTFRPGGFVFTSPPPGIRTSVLPFADIAKSESGGFRQANSWRIFPSCLCGKSQFSVHC
jgi:hypothetical protein